MEDNKEAPQTHLPPRVATEEEREEGVVAADEVDEGDGEQRVEEVLKRRASSHPSSSLIWPWSSPSILYHPAPEPPPVSLPFQIGKPDLRSVANALQAAEKATTTARRGAQGRGEERRGWRRPRERRGGELCGSGPL